MTNELDFFHESKTGGYRMTKIVAVIGAFDTKGQEFSFLKTEIEKHGCKTFMINVGVLGEGPFKSDVTADKVAQAGGSSLLVFKK